MTATDRRSAKDINASIRYAAWAVFARCGDAASSPSGPDLEAVMADLAARDIVIRGLYDVSGMRANADVMVWLHGPTAEALQDALRRLRVDGFGGRVELAWSAMGLHRPAEFNKGHVPAFLTGADPRAWVAVYPFVRSYEWYLLPDEERRHLLVEHGMMGREYTSVLSNTVAAFALGDYEWILALESDELHEIVDLMRHLRGSGARRHVREEIPFYTGRRVSAAEAASILT